MVALIAPRRADERETQVRAVTPEQKTEVVLAGLRGERDRSVRDGCREHEVSETLYYSWRDTLLEGGKAALASLNSRSAEHVEVVELKKKVAALERSLGRKTYELEVAGELSRDWT